jgi:hypothetical protein
VVVSSSEENEHSANSKELEIIGVQFPSLGGVRGGLSNGGIKGGSKMQNIQLCNTEKN